MKRLTLANRLSLRLMAVLTVMSAAIMLIVYYITRESMTREAETRYEGVVLHSNEKIRGVLSDVYVAAINNINDIERDIDNPDRLQAHLEKMVKLNMYMSSCRLIFEPDFYPEKGHSFEIYAWRDKKGNVYGKQMNEHHPDYLVHAWYESAFKKKEGAWMPPYFDRAASQQLTTTYLTHIRDAKGHKVGMLGADVSLDWLRQRQQRIDGENHNRYERNFKDQSYSFIIDNDGTYLIHPDIHRVLKLKLQDVARENGDKQLEVQAYRMMDKQSGSARIDNNGVKSWMFYSYVKYAEWTVVVVVPEAIIYHNGNALATLLLLVFAVGLVLIYILSHRFLLSNLRPLRRLVSAVNQISTGDFNVELPEVKSREIDALRTSFMGMQTSLNNYMNELREATAKRAAMEQELKIASDIQQRMLPKTYPPFPERTDIDIYGEVVTAYEVGGDLFDFFIRDEKLFFSIGDVSGKGVPASLVMAVTRSMFRSASLTLTSPKLIVESINRSVCQSNDSFMFVTLFMGVLDLTTGKLQYANAGHEPPVLVGSHTRFLKTDNNIPLGLRPDWGYSEQETVIMPGTTLFLYTDGFTEAEKSDLQQYGRDRMFKEAIRLAAKRLDSRTFVKEIRQTERRFVDFIPQKDDISLLAIKYRGNVDPALYYRSILLNNDVQEVPVLTVFIDGICDDMQFDDLERSGVHIAVEEAVVNAMQYAYPEGTRGHVYLEVTADDESMRLVLRDRGKAFDPTQVPEVDVDDYIQKRVMGGLGIHLIRHYMDGISYERIDNQNVLTMVKTIKKQ